MILVVINRSCGGRCNGFFGCRSFRFCYFCVRFYSCRFFHCDCFCSCGCFFCCSDFFRNGCHFFHCGCGFSSSGGCFFFRNGCHIRHYRQVIHGAITVLALIRYGCPLAICHCYSNHCVFRQGCNNRSGCGRITSQVQSGSSDNISACIAVRKFRSNHSSCFLCRFVGWVGNWSGGFCISVTNVHTQKALINHVGTLYKRSVRIVAVIHCGTIHIIQRNCTVRTSIAGCTGSNSGSDAAAKVVNIGIHDQCTFAHQSFILTGNDVTLYIRISECVLCCNTSIRCQQCCNGTSLRNCECSVIPV